LGRKEDESKIDPTILQGLKGLFVKDLLRWEGHHFSDQKVRLKNIVTCSYQATPRLMSPPWTMLKFSNKKEQPHNSPLKDSNFGIFNLRMNQSMLDGRSVRAPKPTLSLHT